MRYTKAAAGAKVVVGTRVYCGLRGGSYGVVCKIHGHESPASVRDLGVVSFGGGAEYDIAFDDHLSRKLPECILRGVQWDIYEEVAAADEIVELISKANAYAEEKKREAEAAAVRRAAERAKHLADNPHLVAAKDKPNWSPSRVAAENIRRELKTAFPSVKFAVKKDGYNAVTVKWTNGPTTAMVEAITGKYKAGSFDGMNDIYERNADATFADVFGDPNYVFASRDDTLEGVRYAWVNGEATNAINATCGWGAAEDVTEKWYNGPRADAIRRTWYYTDLTGVSLPEPAKAAA